MADGRPVLALQFIIWYFWVLNGFTCVHSDFIKNQIISPSKDTSLYYSPFYKGPVCTPSFPIQHPESVDDVVNIVRYAIRQGLTAKGFGIRHSQTDIICTTGIPIDMTKIGGIKINPDQSVTVGAGVNLFELCEFLKKHWRGLKTTPGFGNITIGGAIGTGAHGSTIKWTSSISEHVIGITIIDGLGNIRSITDPTQLKGFRIHLGLLGIILSVTLRTDPLYKVQGHNYVVSDRILLDGSFMDIVRNTDQITLYWFPSSNQVVIANWTIVDVNTPGEAWTNDHVTPIYFTASARALPNFNRIHLLDVWSPFKAFTLLNAVETKSELALLKTVPDMAPIYTYNGLTVSNPAVGYYYRMFSPICYDKGSSQCPWFNGTFNFTTLYNEFSIDIKLMPALASTLKDIVSKSPAVFPIQGIILRFSSASDTYMSVDYGRSTCHFEFYVHNPANSYETASTGLAAYQTIIQSVFFKYGGKPHWGKSGAVYHSIDSLARSVDPVAKASFLNLMNEFDPYGIFLNDFGRRLKGTGTTINTDPDVTHCALLDNCFCSSYRDCANGQECSTIDEYPSYPACINTLVKPAITHGLGADLGTELDNMP